MRYVFLLLSPTVQFHGGIAGDHLDKARNPRSSPECGSYSLVGGCVFRGSRVSACRYGHRLDSDKGELNIGFDIIGILLG